MVEARVQGVEPRDIMSTEEGIRSLAQNHILTRVIPFPHGGKSTTYAQRDFKIAMEH